VLNKCSENAFQISYTNFFHKNWR